MMTPSWLRVKKAAAYADAGERTFRDWLKEGLKHTRVHGTIRTKPQWIDEFIEKHVVDENQVDEIVDEVCRDLLKK